MKIIKKNIALGLFALAGIAVNVAPMTQAFAATDGVKQGAEQSSRGYYPSWWYGKKN